jgi:formate dehydrogenase
MYFREAGAEVHSAIETTSPITLWTPHVSGTSLCAQTRYPAGTREILECWFEKRPIRDEYVTVDGEKLAQR